MSAEIANLLVELDSIDDDIGCLAADLGRDPDDTKAAGDMDDLLCRRADAERELEELGYYEQS